MVVVSESGRASDAWPSAHYTLQNLAATALLREAHACKPQRRRMFHPVHGLFVHR